MPLIFITGISGSGKSTVIAELSKRGFETHGVDEEGYADWINKENGKAETFLEDDPTFDIHDWYEKHSWVLSETRIKALKLQSDQDSKTVFLGGLAEGESDIRHLFDKLIYLAIDEATIRQRIKSRTDNSFGQTDSEMAIILGWLRDNDGDYRSNGAIVIDATQPLADVINEVIAVAQN